MLFQWSTTEINFFRLFSPRCPFKILQNIYFTENFLTFIFIFHRKLKLTGKNSSRSNGRLFDRSSDQDDLHQ